MKYGVTIAGIIVKTKKRGVIFVPRMMRNKNIKAHATTTEINTTDSTDPMLRISAGDCCDASE